MVQIWEHRLHDSDAGRRIRLFVPQRPAAFLEVRLFPHGVTAVSVGRELTSDLLAAACRVAHEAVASMLVVDTLDAVDTSVLCEQGFTPQVSWVRSTCALDRHACHEDRQPHADVVEMDSSDPRVTRVIDEGFNRNGDRVPGWRSSDVLAAIRLLIDEGRAIARGFHIDGPLGHGALIATVAGSTGDVTAVAVLRRTVTASVSDDLVLNAFEWMRQCGATRCETVIDARNVSSLALNRRHGMVPTTRGRTWVRPRE